MWLCVRVLLLIVMLNVNLYPILAGQPKSCSWQNFFFVTKIGEGVRSICIWVWLMEVTRVDRSIIITKYIKFSVATSLGGNRHLTMINVWATLVKLSLAFYKSPSNPPFEYIRTAWRPLSSDFPPFLSANNFLRTKFLSGATNNGKKLTWNWADK